MRKTIIVSFLCLVLLPPFAINGLSQTKKRSSGKRPRTTTSAEQQAATAEHQGALQLADQIKNLTKFIYLLGGIAKTLEQSDAAIRRKEAPPSLIESTEASKAKVRSSFQSVRVGLDKLEVDFRASPVLQAYYYKLAGVADGAAKAEQMAAAGQYDQAGRNLLSVINRLTDVLTDMK